MSRTWPLRATDTKGDRMAFCKNCGNQLVDGAKFCGVCGTPVEADPQPAADPFAGASEPKAGQTSGFGAAHMSTRPETRKIRPQSEPNTDGPAIAPNWLTNI